MKFTLCCTFHNIYIIHLAETSTNMRSTTTDIASTSGADGSTSPGMLQDFMLIYAKSSKGLAPFH